MNRLKYKHEIPNYEEKAKVLRENGWEPWYHDDNWIKTEWYDQGKKVDMMGYGTERAYIIVMENSTMAKSVVIHSCDDLKKRTDECSECDMMANYEDPDKWDGVKKCPKCGKDTEILKEAWD